jgi:hypothetical protein
MRIRATQTALRLIGYAGAFLGLTFTCAGIAQVTQPHAVAYQQPVQCERQYDGAMSFCGNADLDDSRIDDLRPAGTPIIRIDASGAIAA